MTELEKFCELVRARSDENRKAILLLHGQSLTGQIISVLRQELDSMVRVLYLLNIDDLSNRNILIRQTLDGDRWRKTFNNSIVTDREMVEISNELNGWAKSVYNFGCAFIHLSNFHDYANQNPFSQISDEENNNIKQHLNQYHSFPLDSELSVQSIRLFLPMVFDKIADNLECYIKELEQEVIGRVL